MVKDGDNEPGCCLRCSTGVVTFLERGFYKIGRIVGTYPWIIIGITSLIGLCCAAGMIKFTQETRTEKLWVPIGSPSIAHKELVEEYFPSASRFEVYLIETDNVLAPSQLQKMVSLYEDVLAITVDSVGNTPDWESICYRIGPTCFVTGLLELWSFNSTLINSLTQDEILDKINEPNLMSPVFFSPVDVELWLGEITKDSDDRIIAAQATTLRFFIKNQGEFVKAEAREVDEDGEAWELKFLELADERSTDDFIINKFSGRSFEDEAGETISGDLSLLAAGYILIIFYVMFSMSKLTLLEQKIYLSLAGIMTVGLSIISSMGLASAFGQFYGPVHSILPFLLLGIGVDDMFVLVASWYNLSEDDKKLEVTEQVAKALKHSGVSITVTSITDFCAFLIGATTILPALRSFCIYCGIGIIFLFFYSITFFLSWLVIDNRRLQNKRDGCCCCYTHKDNYTSWQYGHRNFLQEFFYKYYSRFILSLPVKIIVIVITLGLLGVCTWGTVTWEQNFDFRWFLPTDGALRTYFDANDKYFPAGGFPTAIYLDEVDYYTERQTINDTYEEFLSSEWIQETTGSSWYASYQTWLVDYKAGDPGLNSENWPHNETLFYNWLDEFLSSVQGQRFSSDINFNSDSSSTDEIIASRMSASHIVFKNSREEVAGMDTIRGIARDAGFDSGKDAAFGFSELYENYESNKVIQNELLRNLGLASACVFIVVLLLLANLWQTILVFCCVIFTLVDLAGFLNFWGITIDTVVAVQLILAIGLAVDYSVHIGHTFMIFSGTRDERTRATLGSIGAAVFNGGFSTFLAFILLAGSNSYIFTTFFKIFLLVVFFGLFHGLVFLPVMLSLVGPSPYLSATPVKDPSSSPPDALPPPPRSVTPEQPQEKFVVMDDTKEKGGRNSPRITPLYNQAFVQEDEDAVEMTPKVETNGHANHNRDHRKVRSQKTPHQYYRPHRSSLQSRTDNQLSNHKHHNHNHHRSRGSAECCARVSPSSSLYGRKTTPNYRSPPNYVGYFV